MGIVWYDLPICIIYYYIYNQVNWWDLYDIGVLLYSLYGNIYSLYDIYYIVSWWVLYVLKFIQYNPN